jgi:hypothetical protein
VTSYNHRFCGKDWPSGSIGPETFRCAYLSILTESVIVGSELTTDNIAVFFKLVVTLLNIDIIACKTSRRYLYKWYLDTFISYSLKPASTFLSGDVLPTSIYNPRFFICGFHHQNTKTGEIRPLLFPVVFFLSQNSISWNLPQMFCNGIGFQVFEDVV